MKKTFVLLLLFLLLFGCGCARTEEAPAAPTPSEHPAPSPSALPTPDPLCHALQISELMVKNRSSLTDADGDFSDWIELENISGAALSLDGFCIGDRAEGGWELPARSLEAGERLLLFASGKDRREAELHTDFKLSEGESLSLFTPSGSLSQEVFCGVGEADTALALTDGEFLPTTFASPGFANSPAGYDAWQASLSCRGPLVIHEVSVADPYGVNAGLLGGRDWVEIKNISEETVQLSDYYLSDDEDDYRRWQLPEKKLGPGNLCVIVCTDEPLEYLPCADFELNAGSESLYLSDKNGPVDYAFLRQIPIGGSYGRMEGENGFFYFASSSLNFPNHGGVRRVSRMPSSPTKDGVFNGVDRLSVELQGVGPIHYTLDGSLPDATDPLYEGPLTVKESCVVRAVSIEEGALPGKALTLSFILNENHSLPVLSLVADRPGFLNGLLLSGDKGTEVPGCIALYEEGESFTIDCGISLTGQQSLILPKKSMCVDFRGVYGQDTLHYDVFDTGSEAYRSLALRAGQDNHRLIFRQEIWQDLCYEMTDAVPSQHSKFCVLYLNGSYYGIYCLKENISKDYFAAIQGVDPDSVEKAQIPELQNEHFVREVFDYCRKNDLSDPACYEHICSVLDIENFIDWFLLEGVCGNIDLFRNARFYRSTESDGKWVSVLYDLDHAMLNDYSTDFIPGITMPEEDFPFMGIIGRSHFSASKLTRIVEALLENPDFRDRLLRRYAEVYNTSLSNERILERIDYYQALLEPEVPRDWKKWDGNVENWYRNVDLLRRSITELDWENYARDALCRYLGLSDEEIAEYFGASHS